MPGFIQVTNPSTRRSFDVEILVCRDNYCRVARKIDGQEFNASYDDISWKSPDWYEEGRISKAVRR